MVPFRNGLMDYMNGAYGKLLAQIGDSKLSDELAAQLETAIKDFKAEFVASHGSGAASVASGAEEN